MTSTARLLAIATTLSIALTPLTASSQSGGGEAAPAAKEPTKEAREEARVRFLKGLDLFREADYHAALIEFRRAYELAPNPSVLYNIGQVYFQLQDYANALTSLERYLAEAGKNVPAARRADVEKDIEKLRSRVANLDISANVPDVEIAVDDVVVGRTPLAKPIMVSAGRHKITASKEGFRTATRVVEVASADSLKVPLELIEQKVGGPTPPPDTTAKNVPPPPLPTATATGTVSTPPPPPPQGRGIPWAGWAVTGGLAAGAVITGVLALGASSDLAEQRNAPAQTRESLDDAASKVSTLALVSDIFTGCAVVAGGISLVLTITSGPSSSDRSGPSPAPKAGSTGFQTVRVGVLPGGLQVSGSF